MKIHPWVWLALSLGLLAFSVTGESLWIDEARTYRFSALSGFADLVQSVAGTPNSEAQMPGYLLAAWISDKLIGPTEWAMRAQNYLWGALGLFFFWRSAGRWRMPWMVVLFALHPFLWFYMDEARPYAMQIGLGAWMLDLLLRLERGGALSAGVALEWGSMACLLCGASMLGVIPLGFAVLAALWLAWSGGICPSRGAWWIFGIFFMLLAGMGAYYLTTLLRGAGGIVTETPAWAWSNLAFAGYEFLGLSGMGPGRADLREMVQSGWGNLPGQMLPWVPGFVVLSAGWLACLAGGIPGGGGSNRRAGLVILSVVGAGLLLLLVASRMASFPFWGRHISALLAPVLFLAVLGVDSGRVSKIRWNMARAGGVLLLCGLAWSTAQIRFSPRHQKDDYPSALSLAREYVEGGRTVCWVADTVVPAYYGFDVVHAPGFGYLHNPGPDGLPAVPPDVFFVSRPRDFDRNGTIRDYIRSHPYRLEDPSPLHFQVWHLDKKSP